MKKVLVIEDDRAIVELLEIHLKDLDCEVLKAYTGTEGLEKALDQKPDLIVLDLTLPGMDGLEVCQKIRVNQSTPIIMLTAKSEEIDRVLGLELGADDYITKPFSVREFTARVKAIFRRAKLMREAKEEQAVPKLLYKGLSVDIERRKVLVQGEKVELSPKEFELLVLMASHPGKSYSRSSLLKQLWRWASQQHYRA